MQGGNGNPCPPYAVLEQQKHSDNGTVQRVLQITKRYETGSNTCDARSYWR